MYFVDFMQKKKQKQKQRNATFVTLTEKEHIYTLNMMNKIYI